MTPIKFNNYLSKLGDKHNFSEEAVASGIGTRVGDAPEVEDFTGFYAEDAPDMGARPSGATADEDFNKELV